VFELGKHHTSVTTETIAGLTTFLAMSYILFLNPVILSQAGMDKSSVFVATCLMAAFGSVLMGFLANYPIALAPGMALNSYFTYSVVLGAGYSWQMALGAIFLAGTLLFFLSVLPIREAIINSIPSCLKSAIVAGLGLFLCMIGLKNAGIIVAHPTTFVALGNLHDPTVLLAMLGFFFLLAFETYQLIGSILLSIVIITFLSILLGYQKFLGIFSLPPSLSPVFMHMDLSAVFNMNAFPIIFAFLFVNLFDNTGTLIAIAHKANLMGPGGKIPKLNKVLVADSIAALMSGVVGTSTTTSYLESIVGVNAGGRTGLTSIIVGICFLIALFFAPLAQSIPVYATAPALIYVACLMMRAFADINWQDTTEYIPAVIMSLMIPFTFSIADGIAFGFITYTAIKMLTRRWDDLNIIILFVTASFIIKYMFLAIS